MKTTLLLFLEVLLTISLSVISSDIYTGKDVSDDYSFEETSFVVLFGDSSYAMVLLLLANNVAGR